MCFLPTEVKGWTGRGSQMSRTAPGSKQKQSRGVNHLNKVKSKITQINLLFTSLEKNKQTHLLFAALA